VRTGGNHIDIEGLTAAMELLAILAFFSLLAAASALGWATDSRDGADWRRLDHGRRSLRLL
jgi:hypothetical protein